MLFFEKLYEVKINANRLELEKNPCIKVQVGKCKTTLSFTPCTGFQNLKITIDHNVNRPERNQLDFMCNYVCEQN